MRAVMVGVCLVLAWGVLAPTGATVAPAVKRKGVPRLIVPGAGGAVRRTAKPPTSPPPPGVRPLPGAPPAAVVLPGQTPALPGLPTLTAQPVNRLIYGVNAAWSPDGGTIGWDRDGGEQARRLLAKLKDSGATNTLLELRWSELEPERGRYRWADTDRLVRFLSGHGIELLATFGSAPTWAAPRTDGMPDPRFAADLERIGSLCAQRYRGAIMHWELARDDGGDPSHSVDSRRPLDSAQSYARLLAAFQRGVKRADARNRVAAAGLAAPDLDFLEDLYRFGGRASFDAVGVLPSLPGGGFDLAWLDRVRELLVVHGDQAKPVWVTQWGWPRGVDGGDGSGDQRQARLVREVLVGLRARPWVTQAAYAALADISGTAASGTAAAGLLDARLAPKPALAAFRDAAAGSPTGIASRYQTVSLFGAMSGPDAAGIAGGVNVTVDAGQPGEPLQKGWLGFAQGPLPGNQAALADVWPRLRALQPRLVRFDPFAGGGADWAYGDAVLKGLAQTGAVGMVNVVGVPPSLRSTGGSAPADMAQWQAFVHSAAARWAGAGRAGYWQLSAPAGGRVPTAEWLRLYDAFARAVTAADPKARVGGPSLDRFDAGWLVEFARHCERERVPLHFVSWHVYDAPAGELAGQVAGAREAMKPFTSLHGLLFVVDEWNLHSRPSPDHDGAAAAVYAASVAEGLAAVRDVRALFFEPKEGPDLRRPSAGLWGGWGMLTRDGAPKPVYAAFTLLSKLSGRRLAASSEDPGIHAIACASPSGMQVLVWRAGAADAAAVDDAPARSVQDLPVHLLIRALPWRNGVSGSLTLAPGAAAASSRGLASPAPFAAGAGDLDVPVLLPPGGLALVALRPRGAADVDISLQAPAYVGYAGAPMPVTAVIRNAGSRQRTVTPVFSSTYPSLAPSASPSPIALGPGQSARVTFSIKAPLEAAGTRQFFTVRAGGTAASLGVRFAPAVSVRLTPDTVELPPAAPGATAPAAELRAEVSNRSPAGARVGLAVAGSTRTLTVGPRSVKGLVLRASAPSPNAGNYAVPVSVTLNGLPLDTIHAMLRVPAPCPYTARPPRVNADLSEWGQAYGLPLTAGPANRAAAGQALTMWDAQNLYVALSLDRGTAPGTAASDQDLDRVVLRLEREGRAAGPASRVALVASADRPAVRAMTADGALGEPVAGASLAFRREGGRLVYEAAIPWVGLGMAARDGALLGLTVRAEWADRAPALAWGGAAAGPTGQDPHDPVVDLRLVR